MVRGVQQPNLAYSSVDLRIDALVLDGFEQSDRELIAAALRGELSRLLAEEGLPAGLRAPARIDRVDGGIFAAAAGAGSATIGAQLARSIYRGLSR